MMSQRSVRLKFLGEKSSVRSILILSTLFLMLALAFTACNKKTASQDYDNANDEEAALDAKVKKGIKPVADAEVAVIDAGDYGKIVIELYPNIAPQMVARFKQLIKEGFYNGTTFHRVNPELGIIQGGDPLSRDNNPNNDGTGDSQYPNVPGEMSDIPYERGIVGAARKGASPMPGGGMTETQARDTANCQFFITLKRVPDFDRNYTVFGRVIEGIKNAEIIAGAPVDAGSERPNPKIVIKSITLQPHP